MARSKSGGHPRGWRLMPNPAWAGRRVKGADAYTFCHDGTPSLTVRCACGRDFHVHRGQIEEVPATVTTIAAPCKGCGHVLEFDRRWLLDAIDRAWAIEAEGAPA